MTESNFRLAEHQVEMSLLGNWADGDLVRFETTVDDGEQASAYLMSETKWTAAGEPQTIYVTVTAVLPTSEPADEIEVFRSASTGEFVSEEFAERNPSTTMKHSFER